MSKNLFFALVQKSVKRKKFEFNRLNKLHCFQINLNRSNALNFKRIVNEVFHERLAHKTLSNK